MSEDGNPSADNEHLRIAVSGAGQISAEATVVDTLLGARNANRANAAELRERRELLASLRKKSYVFPGFQFDHEAGTVRDWVAPLLTRAERYERPAEAVILWTTSPTTYFEVEDRPVDHVDDAQRLLDVAERAWGIVW